MTSSQLASGGRERPPVHCDARGPGQDRAQASDGAHPQEARARLLRLRGWQAGLERQAPSLVPSHSGPPGAVLCSYSRWTQLISIYVSMSKFLSDELLEDITGGRCGVGDSVRKISQQWLEVSQKCKHAMFKSKSPEITRCACTKSNPPFLLP